MQPNVIDWTGRNTSSRLLVREIFGLSGACFAGACILHVSDSIWGQVSAVSLLIFSLGGINLHARTLLSRLANAD
jgi:hypothetical protein